MDRRHILHVSIAAILPLVSLEACAVDAVDVDIDDVATEIAFEDDCLLGEVRFCDQNDDPTVDGEQTCIEEDGAVTGWTACIPRQMNGPEDCYDDESWDGDRCSVGSSTISTPIVLRFGVEEVRYGTGGGDFDLTGQGFNVATDWPTAQTPWLAFDRDGDGRIEDGGELFGSATRLVSGRLAKHGFEALRELDENGDGAVNSDDSAYASLRIWADTNADRRSQPGELKSLSDLGVTSLSVEHRVEQVCDARGNCGRERAAFTFVGEDGAAREGEAVDVHLPWR